MSNTPHELAEEFPEHVAKMHDLKISDAHFAKLFEEYHEVNRAIHRAETNVEPVGDTPQAFAAYVKQQIGQWTKVVKEAGIKVE